MTFDRVPVRLKLTFWYSAAVIGVLALYAAVVFAAFERDMRGQLDVLLDEDVEHVAAEAQSGGADPMSEIDEWAEVWSGGRLLYQSDVARHTALPVPSNPAPSEPRTVALTSGHYMRTRAAAEVVRGAPAVVRVAIGEDAVRKQLATLLWIMGLGVPIAAVLAAFGGYHLARRALTPMNAMAERAEAIRADRLHERLPVQNPGDEIGRLAVVINQLLARLEQSFAQMQRFTSDASHELRTPLTAIQTVGEVGLRASKAEAGYRETIGSMLEEVGRLSRLVDAMLMLSRADAGRIPVNREDTSLTALVDDVAQQLGVLAEEKHQGIVVKGAPNVRAHVDPVILRMAIVNLVDNAIRYSPDATNVEIDVSGSADAVRVDVRDHGPGIAVEHQRRLFERFYRADEARSRQTGGSGLGLSIARWAVEAHAGRLDVSSQPGAGSVFSITLPR